MVGVGLFGSPIALAQGLIAGILFGFLLQKGRISRFSVIVGQFLLKDFTVARVMLTAILVGGVAMYSMLWLGMIPALSLKATTVLAAAVGGLVFGVGMALFGYCPGTGLAGLGAGARDVIWGIAGMLVGAAVFEWSYSWLRAFVLRGEVSLQTLPAAIGLSPLLTFLGLLVVSLGLFWIFNQLERR